MELSVAALTLAILAEATDLYRVVVHSLRLWAPAEAPVVHEAPSVA